MLKVRSLHIVKKIVGMFLQSLMVVNFKEANRSLSSFSWSSNNSSSTLKHSSIPPIAGEQFILVIRPILQNYHELVQILHTHPTLPQTSQYVDNAKKISISIWKLWIPKKWRTTNETSWNWFAWSFHHLQWWFHIIIAHSYMTIQWQFYFHQKETNFLCRSYNSSQKVIIVGCERRRALFMSMVQILGNFHQNRH